VFAKLGSLSAKTCVIVVGVLIGVLGVSAYWQAKEEERILLHKLQEEAEDLNVVVNSALHNAMLKADMEGLENTIGKIGRIETVKRIYILDADGKVFRSSDGTLVQDREVREAIEKIKETKKGVFALRETAAGAPFMMGLSPIVSEQACTECHTVKEGETIGYVGLDRWAKQDFQRLRVDRVKTMGVNIAVIIVLLVAMIFITRAITRPVGQMAEIANRIAAGDIEQVVAYRSRDEVGALAKAFRGLIDYIKGIARAAEALSKGDLSVRVVAKSERDALSKSFSRASEALCGLVDETRILIQAAREGRLDVRGDVTRFQGAYAELIEGINEMLDTILLPIQETSAVLERVAVRDLTARMEGTYRGDYAKIKMALNPAVANLDEGLSRVAVAAEQVRSAAEQISDGSQSLAQGASEQASTIEEVASSLQEITAVSKQTAANAQEARGLSESARTSAEGGRESMQRLSAAIDRIKASADETGKIVKTIDEIAFQTNLLALNAAVEAARAGDAGKGFAVVAEEVRNLAMRSAEAAKSSARMIEESIQNADEGVALNHEVLQKLDEINARVQKVSAVMEEIAVASEEQTRGVQQINAAVEQMNQVIQQNAANSEESASAAQELSAQAAMLQDMVATFRLSRGDGSVRTDDGQPQADDMQASPHVPASPAASPTAAASRQSECVKSLPQPVSPLSLHDDEEDLELLQNF
jgi:methyl-accepting chemotaxis protein